MPNASAYPGRVIQAGEKDETIVKAVQKRLNEIQCGPIDVDGDFGTRTKTAVKLFQARTVDANRVPLKVDGVIGAITWAALFGAETVPVIPKASAPLLACALEVAATQIGVREVPKNSNRGPQVDKYLRAAGLDPEDGCFPWCCAFTYWCFGQAADSLGRANPVVRTAGCLDHWRRAGLKGIPRLLRADAVANPALVKPGMVFIMDFGGGKGHTGLVEKVEGGKLVTIEGNTDGSGTREGGGVYRMTNRKIVDMGKGFIDYSGA
jgi:hypothetical protein